MKHAVLITIYKDLFFIKKIIEYFDKDFTFYIHIDRKSKENYAFFELYENVKIFRKYRIEWGGSNHLKAIIYLLDQASSDDEFDYYHLITGSDYPIQTLDSFKRFFENCNNQNFIEYFPLPRKTWVNEGGLARLKYFWIGNNIFDIRKKSKITFMLLKIQRKIGLNRTFRFFEGALYGGGTYWSLSKDAIDVIKPYIRNSRFIHAFMFSHCAEELFFQTILINNHVKCNNNSLRFMVWEGLAESPKVLDETDYQQLISSNCVWARKLDSVISERLIGMLSSKK